MKALTKIDLIVVFGRVGVIVGGHRNEIQKFEKLLKTQRMRKFNTSIEYF